MDTKLIRYMVMAAIVMIVFIVPAKAYAGAKIYKGDLGWFSQSQYLFPRESDAKIIDVDTGKFFMIRRTFGTNHADVEPLTMEDADVIKAIWGGDWSWERRAVVVETAEGHILAASMTAFPHAGVDGEPAVQSVGNRSGGYGWGQNLDAVKGNGVDGHMCLHFLGSSTHGSNNVQAAHQEMVAKAAGYIKENYKAFMSRRPE